jgi:hypothetical protein
MPTHDVLMIHFFSPGSLDVTLVPPGFVAPAYTYERAPLGEQWCPHPPSAALEHLTRPGKRSCFWLWLAINPGIQWAHFDALQAFCS